ncbi:hypothetical protein ACPUER_12030 [Burkholderia sp. DN3021]|uniref:hypothetical protein n=1 Tax=Burkholderia sp. DN3021 TaxID=3410137 RepID=UPI003C7DD3C3
MQHRFHYSGEHIFIKQTTLDDDATWMRVLSEFADYLGAIYGYCVKDKIIVNVGGEYVPLRQQMVDEAINEAF